MLYLKDVSYHPPAVPTAILKNINLELAISTLGLIIGKSGSGKTTLLEILAGLAEPTQGKIYWKNTLLDFDSLQQLGGLVFQFPERHFCGRTIHEELRFGHPELTSDRIEQTLAQVGLDHIPLYTTPHALSGGQQRRLALAVQLIRQPNLLLLDEPTAGLDWSVKKQIVKLLAELKKQISILVVTHDSQDLIDIADSCWNLSLGEITLHEVNQ